MRDSCIHYGLLSQSVRSSLCPPLHWLLCLSLAHQRRASSHPVCGSYQNDKDKVHQDLPSCIHAVALQCFIAFFRPQFPSGTAVLTVVLVSRTRGEKVPTVQYEKDKDITHHPLGPTIRNAPKQAVTSVSGHTDALKPNIPGTSGGVGGRGYTRDES